MNEAKTKPSDYLGELVTIEIDRPVGSRHPQWDLTYPVNYGYLPGTISPDGEPLDAYLLGVKKPVEVYTGRCIAVVKRLDDVEDKLVVAPDGQNYTNDEILAMVEFQEKFFTVAVQRGKSK
jgi:inorganic pyrophosphatase